MSRVQDPLEELLQPQIPQGNPPPAHNPSQPTLRLKPACLQAGARPSASEEARGGLCPQAGSSYLARKQPEGACRVVQATSRPQTPL